MILFGCSNIFLLFFALLKVSGSFILALSKQDSMQTTKFIYSFTAFVFVFCMFTSCKTTNTVGDRTAETSNDGGSDNDEPQDGYYEDIYLQYDNHIYRPNIKTAIMHKKGWELSPPTFKLNSDEGAILKFDDLDGDIKDYSYTVFHCTSTWEPSDLLDSEYIQGFFTDQILDYRYSFNTLQPFTHYELEVPNEQMKITKSGNYILAVYLNNDQEQLVLTKRFQIYEEKVIIKPDVRYPANLDERQTRQEVDFTINYATFPISNPYGDLKVVLTQNQRWDNAVYDLKPLFVKDNELVYDYDEENVFDGSNEFRWFDIKSLKYQSERIRKIETDSSQYHVYLLDDQNRKWAQYSTIPDINGRYIVRTNEGFDNELESEYAWVHFRLPFEQALINGNVYIYGSLSDWQYKKEYQMIYNSTTKVYEATVLLKQGYYNYNYAFLKDNAKTGDLTFFEGSHFATGNDYALYVYYRDITGNYDRLVGVKHFSSLRN